MALQVEDTAKEGISILYVLGYVLGSVQEPVHEFNKVFFLRTQASHRAFLGSQLPQVASKQEPIWKGWFKHVPATPSIVQEETPSASDNLRPFILPAEDETTMVRKNPPDQQIERQISCWAFILYQCCWLVVGLKHRTSTNPDHHCTPDYQIVSLA